MQKKILYIITKGNFGGAQRYLYDVARHMVSEYEIVVATGTTGTLNSKLSDLLIRNVSVVSLQRDPSTLNDLRSVKEIINLLQTERPHIVHLNSSKAGFNGALACFLYNTLTKKELRCKVIFTAHGWSFKEARNAISKGAFYILHSLTVMMSDITIAVSHATKKELSFLPILESKIAVVHNGTDAGTFLTQKKARAALAPSSPHTYWIGTLSELHPNKGLDTAIRGLAPILKSHPEIGFYIAGEGEERSKLEKIISELELRDSVVLLGYVPNAKEYLKAFDVFTLTSRNENLPYAILESGFAGVPVIASNVGGISEIITNLESGLLMRPNSKKDITQAVSYAIEHTKEMSLSAKRLKTLVSHDFSLKSMISKTAKIYRSI